MTSGPHDPTAPTSDPAPHDKLISDQREANEHLVLLSVRAHEDVEQAEAARAVAETERARLFEDAGWGVAIVSDVDNRMDAVNPAFAIMHGYSVEELVGRGLEVVCPPSTHTQLRDDIRILHEKGHHLFEGPHVRKDGSHFPCLTEATAPKVGEGVVGASAYNFQDVNERTQLKARLAVADRLAALGTMSAGLAHEINNPLTYNLSGISQVRNELPVLMRDIARLVRQEDSAWRAVEQRSDGLLAALREAQEGAERIQRIVAEMNTFARPLDHGFEVGDVQWILEAAMRVCQHQCMERAKLVRDFRKVPRVNCSDGQLGQVFVNLLVNAAQAIEPGRAEHNEIRVLLDTDATGDALIEISDTGTGISPEVMGQIYHPFFTTKSIGVGSGLGLSVAHSIVAAHGGRISAESLVGKGTTFRIHLPSAHASPKVAAPKPAEATSARRAKVLIIDDDASVGRALRRMLDKAHETVVLDSAVAAVALLDGGEQFDVIFCDLMMPDMTGVEFFEWVAVNRSQLASRVLFITGGAVSAGSRELTDRFPDQVVLKPFDSARIAEMIAQLMASTT